MQASLTARRDPAGSAGPGAPAEPAAAGSLRPLLVLLLLGAALRAALWWWFSTVPIYIDDERDYDAIATNLVRHGEFALSPGRPTSIRPPLYPAFVAGTYTLFGVGNYQAVRLAQAVLSLLTTLMLYWLGREALSPRGGLWVAGLYCFYPSMLGMNNMLLTEVLFTFFLVAACLAVVLYYRRASVGWLALAGVLLGLAALTRSVVWLTPPLLAAFVLLTGRGPDAGSSIGLGKRLLAASAMLLTFSLTLAPWTIRNTLLQKTFITVDTMGGRNLMMGNYEHTPLYRAWDAVTIEGEQSWIQVLLRAHPELQDAERTTQGQIDKLAMKQGVAFIRENPGLTARRDLVKFLDFWGLERELISRAAAGAFGPLPRGATAALALLILGSYAALLFLGVYGAFLAPPADRRVHWFLLAVLAFVTAVHTLVFGHSRYHLPLMPLVLLYAASAILSWRSIWQRRRSLAFVAATAVCAGLVLGWGWSAVARDWQRALEAARGLT